MVDFFHEISHLVPIVQVVLEKDPLLKKKEGTKIASRTCKYNMHVSSL